MPKKFWTAALIAFIILFAYGFLIFGVVLMSYYENIFKDIARTEMVMWPYVVISVIVALVMAYMYPKGYEGGTPWVEGLRFGLVIAVLRAGTSMLDFYATLPIPGSSMFVGFFADLIGTCIAGAVIGIIYGNLSEASQPAAD